MVGQALDGYAFKARYLPALIVLLPSWLAFAVWFPVDKQFIGTFASAGLTTVLSVLLAQLGRDAGKARQKELFKEWGGAPTTRALSYRGKVINPITLARCHAALMAAVPGLQLPDSKEAEKADWDSAKKGYESASDFLREATRDKAVFRLVYAENVNYGFRRNLWAMKPAGIAISVLSIVAVSVHASQRYLANEPLPGLDAAAAFLSAALIALWLARFNKAWVRTAADEYSTRLVTAAETLNKQS